MGQTDEIKIGDFDITFKEVPQDDLKEAYKANIIKAYLIGKRGDLKKDDAIRLTEVFGVEISEADITLPKGRTKK